MGHVLDQHLPVKETCSKHSNFISDTVPSESL